MVFKIGFIAMFGHHDIKPNSTLEILVLKQLTLFALTK